MRGLTQGEQSTLAVPALQLMCRSGGVLTDLYSGSFVIQDVRHPTAAPAELVASTPIVGGTHKVGTGRYAIITGATTTWKVGTHRAVCSYVMEAGGPTFTQVIEFEVLDAIDWPVGASYTGYLSTRQAYADSFVDDDTTRAQLHRTIAEVSKKLEMWTGRWFEPRYLKLVKNGQHSPILLLQEPIIAIEDIYAVWQTTTGSDTYKYEQYLYKVYNRHLDGFYEEDDRANPKIHLTDTVGDRTAKLADFAWPYGNQNIEVRGVFGYTDPELDPNNSKVLIGSVPRDIARACGTLVARTIEDPTMTSLLTWAPGSVKSMRTRDQSVSFGGAGGGAGGGGGMSEPSGDPLVDQIIGKYRQPWAVGGL